MPTRYGDAAAAEHAVDVVARKLLRHHPLHRRDAPAAVLQGWLGTHTSGQVGCFAEGGQDTIDAAPHRATLIPTPT